MRVVRWIAYLVGGVVVAFGLFLTATWFLSNARLNRVYEVEVTAPELPTDAASIAEGERLVATRFCADCHGADLGGAVMADDLIIGRLWATNLTAGEGGVGSQYSNDDYARAIWYGVGSDGKPLLFMPSHEFHAGIDENHLALMMAYIRSVPPVDREVPQARIGPLPWVGHVVGFFPLAPVEMIDLSEPPIAPVEIAATAEYGATIGVSCSGCHGAELAGQSDPAIGDAPNLTPHETGLAGWSYDDFRTAMRTGEAPDGSTLDPENMPWPSISRMTDLELEALWAYLSSLEPTQSAIQ